MGEGEAHMVSDTVIVAIITALVSISASIGATWMQTRKWREGEQPRADADTTDVLTGTSLELVQAVRKEMQANKETAMNEIMTLRGELATVRIENYRMREKLTELEDVREWAERLVHQVRSLGGEPVKMRAKIQREGE